MTITLLHGDCRSILPTLPARSVQSVVTSPPYFGLRRYDVEGEQIGAESTPAEYVASLVAVFREVRRVLREDGTVWLNLGDSYAGNSGRSGEGEARALSSAKFHGGHAHLEQRRVTASGGVPEKNLLGMPWRVAFALQEDGWILRSDIVWSKPNPMPESVRDRPTRSHEYIFLLSKSPRYYCDMDAISEPGGENTHGGKSPNVHKLWAINGASKKTTLGVGLRSSRNRRSVWTVSTRPYSGAHFAVFPEELIEPCILAGSAEKACEHCGAPWERRIEKVSHTLPYQERYGHPSHNGRPPQQSGYFWTPPDTTDLGFFPSCSCLNNTGSGRSVILDPFVGSGTSCRVSERLNRDSIGIDLGYADLQEERTNGVQRYLEGIL